MLLFDNSPALPGGIALSDGIPATYLPTGITVAPYKTSVFGKTIDLASTTNKDMLRWIAELSGKFLRMENTEGTYPLTDQEDADTLGTPPVTGSYLYSKEDTFEFEYNPYDKAINYVEMLSYSDKAVLVDYGNRNNVIRKLSVTNPFIDFTAEDKNDFNNAVLSLGMQVTLNNPVKDTEITVPFDPSIMAGDKIIYKESVTDSKQYTFTACSVTWMFGGLMQISAKLADAEDSSFYSSGSIPSAEQVIRPGDVITLMGSQQYAAVANSTTSLRLNIPFTKPIIASSVEVVSGSYAARGNGKSSGYIDIKASDTSTTAVISETGVSLAITYTSAKTFLSANYAYAVQPSNLVLRFS